MSTPKTPKPCPRCGASWQSTELMFAAQRGGGYTVRCHECNNQWDDPDASHGDRATLRNAVTRTTHHARQAPRARGDLFVYWQDAQGGWRWRLKGRNGKVIDSSSESFTRKWSARRNAYLTTRRLEAWVGRTGNV